MKRIAVVTIIFILMTGIAYAKDYEAEKKAGEYIVEVRIDKNPPVVGDNKAEIRIKGASGKYVTNAEVNLYYFMPAMPAMNKSVNAKLEGNRYTAVIKPMMPGGWDLDIKFKGPDGNARKVTISLEVK